jgi:hypothetical protein
MPNCSDCAKWLLRCETRYEGGETITTWSSPAGGKCTGPLNGAVVPATFGCFQHVEGGPLIEAVTHPGHAWEHKTPGPCPECKTCSHPECTKPGCPGTEKCIGAGCARCCNTGTVLYYGDGYVGENRTKLHPKEREQGKRGDSPTPICGNCGKSIGIGWKICPYCETNLTSYDRPDRPHAIDPSTGVNL